LTTLNQNKFTKWRNTPDESCDNPFDIDKPGIYCAIPSGWPDFFYDIYSSFCIVGFFRYASLFAGTLFRSNTSGFLNGDCVELPYHNEDM